jgi:hypothetical protein
MQRLSHDILLLLSQKLPILDALMLISVSHPIRKALVMAVNKRPELLSKRVLDTFFTNALAYFRENYASQTFELKLMKRTQRLVCLSKRVIRVFPCFIYTITSPEDRSFMLLADITLHPRAKHTILGQFDNDELEKQYKFSFHFTNEEEGNMRYYDFGGYEDEEDKDNEYMEGGPWKAFKDICL